MEKNIKTTTNDMKRIDKASLLEVLEQASIKLDNNIFHIKKHSDKTILIYDEKDNVLYKPVLPILREINISKKLGVDLFYPNSTEKKILVI